ncbi:MAG: hypothetical protein OEW87_05845, partial [Flavobacteriaceae bacterium]|nr:hypothetical protein [Flavobacteriaceae bacterium]
KYPSKDSIKGKDFAIILKQGQKREHWCFINLFDGIQVTDDETKVNELVNFFKTFWISPKSHNYDELFTK